MAQDQKAETIRGNSLAPKRAQNETGSVEQHGIADQILADEYARKIEASKRRLAGVRFVKIVPPGAV